MKPRRHFAVAAALLALSAGGARAQTLVTGGLSGAVTAQAGGPLNDVRVTLVHAASRTIRHVQSDAAGRFAFGVLPIGLYEVRAEKIGYRPALVRGVAVEAGVRREVTLALLPEQPPVTIVDTVILPAGASRTSGPSAVWSRGSDLPELTNPQGFLPGAAVAAGMAPRGLELEGLPSRMSAFSVDGNIFGLGPGPRTDRPDLDGLGMPLLAMDGAELNGFRADGAWTGFGGGLLRADAPQGPRRPQPRAFLLAGNQGMDAGAIIGAPLLADTAGVVVGVLASRRRPQYDAPWTTTAETQAIATVAQDSFATDLAPYLSSYEETADVVQAFARFDWQVSRGGVLSAWSGFGYSEVGNVAPGDGEPAALGATLRAREVNGGGALTTRLSRKFALDVRFGVESGSWDYRRAATPYATFADAAMTAGNPAVFPGKFDRTGANGAATLYLRLGPHLLRAALSGGLMEYRDELAEGRAGAYAFGASQDLAARRGAFTQLVGSLPTAGFRVTRMGYLVGDQWQPTATINVMAALRFEHESYPTGDARTNTEWQRLTGLDNGALAQPDWRLLPRFAIHWTAADRRWGVHADAGRYLEARERWVFDEWLAYDRGVSSRRQVGDLGSWPDVPDSTSAPLTGTVLTLLNPDLESPRSSRLGFGVDRGVGAFTTLRLRADYRHTDYLARRSDINLRTAPVALDQDGRPVYGELVQEGGVLAVRPGTNRRFADFDVVTALDPTGFSDYVGLTVALDREVERGIAVHAAYTFSRTRDNLPGLRGGPVTRQLTPFPDSTGSADWREGISDLDVPHRAALGLEYRTGGRAGVRLGALVRWRSGYPYTPGFRDGVDVNGDGAWDNDPAFVDDTLPGMADVIAANSCLADQAGGFAERNACRRPAVVALDLRFAVRVFAVNGLPAELVVDGLNLAQSDDGIVDRALYLVDPAGSIGSPAAGRVRLPLVVNPDFGKLLVRRAAPAAVRAGLRFNF